MVSSASESFTQSLQAVLTAHDGYGDDSVLHALALVSVAHDGQRYE